MTTQILSGFSQNDRLGVSVFGSFLVHMVVILGVTFTVPKLRELPGLPTLEITLVQTASDKRPKDPEFLAQANQDGGGDSDASDIAKNPLPVREISPVNRDFPTFQSVPQKRVQSEREITTLLTQEDSHKIKARDAKPDKKDLQQQPPNLGLMARAQIDQERARLNAEISRTWQEYQKRPRHMFLNARTEEYKYAAYMDAWRAKVERIGNLNYPEEAKQRHLTGNLLLDVALNADGSINNISIRRSSGQKILDDAAIRIVELAAPFAPFPPDIRADTDVLHITRTWKFNESQLSSEN
ncbi:MAG TPA: energy transducer TonB [Candidatus Methylomirabilis sp.]|nr:energy transducer TonB [Candidatus Methylomirabilis sp.]